MLPNLTADVILGIDWLQRFNPNINWSHNTVCFSCATDGHVLAVSESLEPAKQVCITVDAASVPGSTKAKLVSANAWL